MSQRHDFAYLTCPACEEATCFTITDLHNATALNCGRCGEKFDRGLTNRIHVAMRGHLIRERLQEFRKTA
ncbi:hypothetical protein [Parvibaculum sp.]|uniref:hypothetical protein n=1 Tax=Parvibaculum sp. TaxID=2024848 RepID=UPI002B7F4C85|nr:hypothetical protein [Parvibaculum sp.]HUD50990.1 hypothetical protein [Parvibaculum sp.]